jgi:hypothetical protein
MLLLDYSFSPSRFAEGERWISSATSEIDLRYHVALGNLKVVVDDVDYSPGYDWIPLLDFAVSLADIRKILTERSDYNQVFEFTESDATITFRRISNFLDIHASYLSICSRVEFSQFAEATSTFFARLFREAENTWPLLSTNPAFQELQQQLAAGGGR